MEKTKLLVGEISKDVMKEVNSGPVGSALRGTQPGVHKASGDLACFGLKYSVCGGEWFQYCWKARCVGGQAVSFQPVLRAFWYMNREARVRTAVGLGLGENETELSP